MADQHAEGICSTSPVAAIIAAFYRIRPGIKLLIAISISQYRPFIRDGSMIGDGSRRQTWSFPRTVAEQLCRSSGSANLHRLGTSDQTDSTYTWIEREAAFKKEFGASNLFNPIERGRVHQSRTLVANPPFFHKANLPLLGQSAARTVRTREHRAESGSFFGECHVGSKLETC